MKIYLILILSLFLIGNVSAILGEYRQNDCVPIIVPTNASSVTLGSITSPSPNPILWSINSGMTNLGGGSFNYSFCNTTRLGTYSYAYCENTGDCYGNTFIVKSVGDQNDTGITSFDIMIIVALAVALFAYMKISKFLGTMGIMLIGLGILFRNSLYGWIGWIIIATGFLAMIIHLMSDSKPSNGYRRRY